MYKRILLGVDGSDDSYKAIGKLKDFHKNFNSEIVVFHSIEHKMSPPPDYQFNLMSLASASGVSGIDPARFQKSYTTPYGEIRDYFTKIGQGYLQYVKDVFNQDNVPVETRLVVDIKPEKYIIEKSVEEKFDLVVVGCKGHHSKLRRAVLGTVADYVLNNAKCDVLVMR